VKLAAVETGIDQDQFPERRPFEFDQLLDNDYRPG
jgi:hypothetical protein